MSKFQLEVQFLTVKTEGNRQVTRAVQYYNLGVIISVGYRVKSQAGTLFRQWALKVLKIIYCVVILSINVLLM